MQAKSDPGQPVKPGEPQLWLYRHWPNFVITSPGFDRRTRTCGGDQRSGRYALVSNKGWRVLSASDPLARNSRDGLDLSEFLVNMLYDIDPAQRNRTSAHGRQVYQNSKKDWSPTIRELLEVTGVRALRYKGLYASELSRLGGEVLQMILHVAIPPSLAPPGHVGVETGEGGGEGISILVIATRSLDSMR